MAYINFLQSGILQFLLLSFQYAAQYVVYVIILTFIMVANILVFIY